MRRVRSFLLKITLTLVVLCSLSVFAFAAERSASNPTEFYQAMYAGLSGLETEFSIRLEGDFSRMFLRVDDIWGVEQVRAMAVALPNEDGTGADVVMMNIEKLACSREGDVINFRGQYLLNNEQMAWVNTQLDPILSELQIEGESDYMKIKKIYQYVGTHFNYDKTLSKFTDYDGLTSGTMVCQGYALLTYKLLWRAGIPARIVVGTSANQPHGWNIVKLDGAWYNLDTTWDAADSDTQNTMYWNYFLKNDADFYGHVRESSFDSELFRTTCPMAENSFSAPAVEVTIDGTLFSGLTIRNGLTLQLGTILEPESSAKIHWSSTDNSIVSVDENGQITSIKPGKVNITATAEDKAYIPGVFPVTAVEMRTCSPWAEKELVSYYLRTYYPAVLCSDYQQPITRAEFAQLLEILVSSIPQDNVPYRYPGMFKDIAESPNWFSIVYCTSRGLFAGTSETTFSPDGTLTREQAAKLLCTLLDFFRVAADEQTQVAPFADADAISGWAVQFVDRAVRGGLMQGDGERFDPQAPVSREMAAVLLERVFVRFLEPLKAAVEPAA